MTYQQQQVACAPATLRSEILLVFALMFSVFLLTSSGFDTSEGSYDYTVAHQIWTQGALGFAEHHYGVYTVAPNGRTYASHEFGNTLFLLPVAGLNVALEKALASRYDSRRIGFLTGFNESLMSVIYCAVTIALFYAMLRMSFNKSAATALASSLSLAFCTFIWTYSRNLFDGVLCMCLLTGAMLSMAQFKKTARMRYFTIAIALCGFGVITRLTMVLSLAAFLVYLTTVFWRDRKQLIRMVLIAISVLAPFATWQMYYNHLRDGHWLIAPMVSDQYAATCGLTGNLALGMSGLLFSPGKSIFVYIPLALLSVVCFRRFITNYPYEATFVAVLSGMWLILHAKLATNWYGAWGWGPRHFITIAPVLALPACVNWEWMKESVWRRMLLRLSLTWGAILGGSSIIGNWHFRMALAEAQGRHNYDAMLWSLSGGQALDMITGAMSNLRNIVLRAPIPSLAPFSPINCYASNTINVWINSAAYAGLPWALLAATALVLVAVAAYCLIALRRIIRQRSQAEVL
jgi:hypothetical protein